MTRDEYRGWATKFAVKFGLNHDGGIEMVLSWYDDLESRSATIAELIAVARYLTDHQPERREHYRGAVFGTLSRFKHEKLRAEQSRRIIGRAATENPAPGATIREMLMSRNLLTKQYRRENGLPAEPQPEPTEN
jgi:hypothetical protein